MLNRPTFGGHIKVSAVVQWDIQTNTQKQPAQSDMYVMDP